MFLHALYNLVSHPEYITPIREEIEPLVATLGWQKKTVTKMRKLDSFLKESIRLHPLSASKIHPVLLLNNVVGSSRYVDKKPFTFSNGVTLPVGATVMVPVLPVHQDEDIYKNASKFEGFRFYKMREEEGDTAKTYCVNTNHNFLTFGHGTHAW